MRRFSLQRFLLIFRLFPLVSRVFSISKCGRSVSYTPWMYFHKSIMSPRLRRNSRLGSLRVARRSGYGLSRMDARSLVAPRWTSSTSLQRVLCYGCQTEWPYSRRGLTRLLYRRTRRSSVRKSKVRLTIPTTLLAFAVLLMTCSLKLRALST